MQAILAVTFPFFALVLLGYLAVQRGLLPESAIPGLNGFVLFFALPCMLFRFGASMPLARLLDPVLIAIYLGGALLMVLFTIALTLRRHADGPGVPMKDAAFGALVAAFPNSGFMGFPLLIGLLGEGVAGPLIGCILIDLVVTSSLCLALAQLRPATETSSRQPLLPSFARAMRGAFSNPLPWAIALGALVAATGLVLPGPLTEIVRLLGDAATPVALFTIGAVLWRAQQHATTRTPPASITRIIMVSTALAFVSFSLVAWVFGVRRD